MGGERGAVGRTEAMALFELCILSVGTRPAVSVCACVPGGHLGLGPQNWVLLGHPGSLYRGKDALPVVSTD